jgi:hypothetical protein
MSERTCAGLLGPITSFAIGAFGAALIIVTVAVFGFGQFDAGFGPAVSWHLMMLSSILLIGLNLIGFMVGMAYVPLVVRRHMHRVHWLSAGTGALCVAIPTYALGLVSVVFIPLVAVLLTVAVMRSARGFGILITERPREECWNCGYPIFASGSDRCPECGECAVQGESGSSHAG